MGCGIILDNLEPKNAPMYNVRGTKQELKEEMSNESTGTIEYAIKHPNVFIRASSDWLYYKEMFGNQYLWIFGTGSKHTVRLVHTFCYQVID